MFIFVLYMYMYYNVGIILLFRLVIGFPVMLHNMD